MTMVTLTVMDAKGASSQCTGTVTVVNNSPTANAGADQSVDEGAVVMMSGSGSDPDAGQTLTFMWTQTGGPAVTLTGANTATPTFTAPQVAQATCVLLTFQLKVTDSCGAMTTDTVTVSVNDVLVLDGGGQCLRLFRCSGKYLWRKTDGTQIMNFCTITVTGTMVTFQSVASDPNYLSGGISRNMGNARLEVPRGRGGQVFSFVDTNTTTGACP
jgi:hypothetical protein